MNKFELKDRLDNAIYSAYNILSDMLFRIDVKARRLVRRNAEFKNIHANQRCFILGTGPSLALLAEDQIETLKSEILFGANSFYRADSASVLRPKYYALVDDLYWKDWSNVFAAVAEKFSDAPPAFITDPRAQPLVDALQLETTPIYVSAKRYPTTKMSAEIDGNAYATMNVVGTCLLVAIYMGFKEIYLLGCDYNAFCTSGRGHCYDDKKELAGISYSLGFFLKYYWITTEFHYLIAKLAKAKGVEVVNLTETSLLDAYSKKPTSAVL